jgi:HEAT repeat protein
VTKSGRLVLPPDFFERSKKARVRYAMALAQRTPGAKTNMDAIRNWHQGGDPRLIGVLIEIVERDPEVDVQRAAFQGLSRIPDPAAIPGLLPGLRSSDRRSRYFAVCGLGRLRAREAVPGLLPLLHDRYTRAEVAAALVAIRDERALEPLRGAATSGWPRTRRRLRRCIASLESDLGY